MIDYLPVVNACDGVFDNSLDVRFTKFCDNGCSFCIESPGLDNQGHDLDAKLSNTVEVSPKTVLVLGGEPLLFMKDVLEYVKGIRDCVPEIFVTTSLPITIQRQVDEFNELMNLLDGLNVSLQHYDWKRNNEVLKAKHRHDRIHLLSEVLKNPDHAEKIRVSINLVKGGMDSKEELKNFWM